jgi:hypothetical protein
LKQQRGLGLRALWRSASCRSTRRGLLKTIARIGLLPFLSALGLVLIIGLLGFSTRAVSAQQHTSSGPHTNIFITPPPSPKISPSPTPTPTPTPTATPTPNVGYRYGGAAESAWYWRIELSSYTNRRRAHYYGEARAIPTRYRCSTCLGGMVST